MWLNLDPHLRFVEPRPLKLLDYWNAKRGTRAMPSRAEIVPTELGEHLANLVLIEVGHQPLRLRYRLIGTAITKAMECDNTGRYYDEIYRRT